MLLSGPADRNTERGKHQPIANLQKKKKKEVKK